MEIRNLYKKYGENTVYDNFSLDIGEGEITCMLGESGSGKTTLLNCIAGLTEYGGEIPKRKCSYIFQTPRLVPNLTVYKNLALVRRDGNIDAMLERVRLTDKRDAYPCSLSGGQAQRVAIARAFLYESDIILMDEPFSSLDLKLKREMSELFLKMQEEYSRTALFVTHDVDEAVNLAHRIIVIKGGRVVFDANGKKEELRSKLTDALLNG